ncbi:MAG: RidA family protein [Magnetovibrionaceae bacterium]
MPKNDSPIERIMPEGSPPPVAPYSHAAAYKDLVFVTGQMPLDPETNTYIRGSAAEQLDACMRNLETILDAAKTDWSRVLHVRIFMTDFSRYDELNEAYKAWFPEGGFPARTCVGVTGLAGGAEVEVDLVAVRGD